MWISRNKRDVCLHIYDFKGTSNKSIAYMILPTLKSLNIKICNFRSLTYDGASNISGCISVLIDWIYFPIQKYNQIQIYITFLQIAVLLK